ncbi:mycofactocin-coupled SDR family oxidoreductase [Nocardia harenae]|uniref:mycofactocin-coupled SDR family oxidoreductase n=1 Tax=Nocardia harenae TaxID=358707 RepID=UPI000831BB70|nr:mycofactocin-coupled SDR family oxidoreductase [Nocardia harenae]
MAGSLEGRVAFITGVARGQGRAHAVRLARAGVDIIGVDICADYPHMNYSNATEDDLAETVELVEKEGRRIVARVADVRDYHGLKAAFDEGYAEFGRVDIVIANAGIIRLGDEQDFLSEWQEVIDTNLTGVFHTVRAALPALKQGGRGGSIVLTSSTAGLKGTGSAVASSQAYAAAKRGLVGFMQTLANDLAAESIRVNTIHPTGVVSGMTQNPVMDRLMAEAAASKDNAISAMQNALPIPILQAEDIANAVAWLVSDEAYYITGVALPLDAGFTVR